MSVRDARRAGYAVVANRDGLLGVDTVTAGRFCSLFGTSHLPYEYDGYGTTYPHLSEMTEVALDILDKDSDGLFLMVEGGRIDHACHATDLLRAVAEVVRFETAVRSVIEWMGSRGDTLIMVAADHEIRGLEVVQGNGEGSLPTVTWSTGGHGGTDAPVYATGWRSHFPAAWPMDPNGWTTVRPRGRGSAFRGYALDAFRLGTISCLASG